MRVTGVDVIWPSSIGPAPFFFVQVRTDEGLVGLGQAPDPRRTMPVVLEWAERPDIRVERTGNGATTFYR